MTKPKTSSHKPTWFDRRKYRDKSKLSLLQWYAELLIRKSLLEQVERGMDMSQPLTRLREETFATLGDKPIIPESQLKSLLKKDIWSERGYKSHSARLSTCMDIFKLTIREDIETECKASTRSDEFGFIYETPVEGAELMHNTPIDLQYIYDDLPPRYVHLTIDLNSPSTVLKKDIDKIVDTLKKEYGNKAEIITSKKRNWAISNVLEHIDLHLAEAEQGEPFKPSARANWIPPNSNSDDISKASTREKGEALKLLDDQALHQLYIEIYSADKKAKLDHDR
jgi:hypothetical protein